MSDSLATVARQAPLSMGFPRQESWSGLPFLSPGDLPNPGIETGSPVLQADSLLFEPPGKKDNDVLKGKYWVDQKTLSCFSIPFHGKPERNF